MSRCALCGMLRRAMLGLVVTASLAAPSVAQVAQVSRAVIRQYTVGAGVGDTVRRVKANKVDTVAVRNERGVTLRAGEVLVVPTGRVHGADTIAGEAHVDLPNRYFAVDATSRLVTLRLRVSVAGRGLRYVPEAGAFVGDLLIGLEDTLRLSEVIQLSAPVAVQVSGEADVVEPGLLHLTHTNVPFETVRIRISTPADTVRVIVQPVFDPTGVRTPIPVFRPPVHVHATPKRIQGFGLQTATITILVDEPPVGVSLMVRSASGDLEKKQLVLAEGATSTTIRSTGIGFDTIHAELGQLAAGYAVVDYRFPWLFLAAAVLGGLLGSFVRSRLKPEDKSFGARLALGIALGLIGAVAYALGLNLTGLAVDVRFGEAVTFLIAAVSAALDLPGLTAVREKLTANK